ncbi:conserved hypothetical protein [Theileria equi strain WA]|uniref:RRM domain-containing protein n=1 Tax=Theileria equi strain WA TaxID=1537102 RepID=L1LBL1_THEEQ|nr:conserved hypothetical protein [Theileria equi strain WA]EKX72563.1 conserved hypothetical protein [Theileria equi strain WA]|eukprot:XP_004832015.1 conserved hypothetical protein [Theileria equi strain WA]
MFSLPFPIRHFLTSSNLTLRSVLIFLRVTHSYRNLLTSFTSYPYITVPSSFIHNIYKYLGPPMAPLGLDPLATRPYREIYVGNIPPVSDVSTLLDFLNEALIAINGTSMPGNPCLKGWISSDSHYAFIELRTMEEASNCMQLTGLNCMGYNIRVNRPKTYTPEMLALAPSPTVPTLDPSLLAMGLKALKNAREQIVAASDILATEKAKAMTDRLCIIDIPSETQDSDLKSAIEAIGQVKYIHFINDDPSKRVCLFEYQHIEQQKIALEQLPANHKVIMAIDAVTQGIINPSYIRQQLEKCEIMRPEVPTRVLWLSNLVSKEELDDDAEYFDIIDDVRTECEDYGQVIRLELPRVPKGLTEEEMKTVDTSSVGCAFVLFTTIDGCTKARKILGGRRFGPRIVDAHYFSELYFLTGRLGNPIPNLEREHSSLYNPKIVTDPNSAADILRELEEKQKA